MGVERWRTGVRRLVGLDNGAAYAQNARGGVPSWSCAASSRRRGELEWYIRSAHRTCSPTNGSARGAITLASAGDLMRAATAGGGRWTMSRSSCARQGVVSGSRDATLLPDPSGRGLLRRALRAWASRASRTIIFVHAGGGRSGSAPRRGPEQGIPRRDRAGKYDMGVPAADRVGGTCTGLAEAAFTWSRMQGTTCSQLGYCIS